MAFFRTDGEIVVRRGLGRQGVWLVVALLWCPTPSGASETGGSETSASETGAAETGGSETAEAFPLPVHEAFDGPALDADWSWLREDAVGWRLAGGVLEIRTSGILWNDQNTQQNLLLRPLPVERGVLAIEVTVDGRLATDQPYEHGGLIWYLDDDHWLTLTQLNHVAHETQKVMLVHEDAGRGRHEASFAVPYDARRVVLRLEVDGRDLRGLYRAPEDERWQLLGTISYPEVPGVPKIGLTAGGGTEDGAHWIAFDDFRIVGIRPGT